MFRIIFTDLDGTLLDHDTYSYAPALPALNQIQELGIPLVFCSSKTSAELEALREELKLEDPFISENGGGIHFPAEDRVVELGLSHQELSRHLFEISGILEVKFLSMEDMEVDKLASFTGLSRDEALLAQKRCYDLAFIAPDSLELDLLGHEVERRGLKLTRGARFLHLTGDNDKGRAIRELVRIQGSKHHEEVETIGLGDSENDLPMLKEVDIPVIIPNPGSRAPVQVDAPRLIVASSPGPVGWNEVVLELLRKNGCVDPPSQ